MGRWLLISASLHLLLAASLVILWGSDHKPAAVIDLSELAHSWREAGGEQGNGGTQQEPVVPAPMPQAAAKPKASKAQISLRSPGYQ